MKDSSRRLLYWVFIGLPMASLALNAVSWLRFGLDLPFFDDWRGYAMGLIRSLDLHYLFYPINDTMAPVGFALDALAQRYLDGNSIAYQFLSMLIVLGSLLLLQWRLLRQALGNPQLAAICFLFTLLMLQPGSYWGRENMAYHQALPLVFILSSLTLLLSESARDIWRMPLILALSLLAGFSYVSGAFGVLAVGIALLLACTVSTTSALRKTLMRGGMLLTLSGTFSSTIQYVRTAGTHRQDVPLALPTEPDFWLFYLGKLGRSLTLPQGSPILSLAITLSVCALAFALILSFAARHRAEGLENERHYRVGVVFFVIATLVFVYLLLIAVGRTNLRPPEVKTATQIFSYGFYRFHFFWATLLWPWFAAALIVTWQELRKTAPARIESFATTVAVLMIPFMIAGGVFGHARQYKAEAFFRIPTIECLAKELQRDDTIDCPEFGKHDFRAAYAYGRSTGASFVRHFPILPVPFGSDEPAPWFRLTRDKAAVTMRNMDQGNKDGLPLLAGADPEMLFQTGKDTEMGRCLLLDISIRIQVTQPDTAQLYYRTRGNASFSEQESQQLPVNVNANEPQRLNFRLSSPSGFEDAFRFDPVSKAQQFNVSELEARCRWSRPVQK